MTSDFFSYFPLEVKKCILYNPPFHLNPFIYLLSSLVPKGLADSVTGENLNKFVHTAQLPDYLGGSMVGHVNNSSAEWISNELFFAKIYNMSAVDVSQMIAKVTKFYLSVS